MPTSRVTITLPGALVERIDRAASNRSRFIAEAVERELHRRMREALRRSLDAPHAECLEVADQGLGEFRAAVAADAMDLVDPAAGTDVAWREGEGWQPGRGP